MSGIERPLLCLLYSKCPDRVVMREMTIGEKDEKRKEGFNTGTRT